MINEIDEPKIMSTINEIELNSVYDILNVIQEFRNTRCIFRGQSSYKWTLIPSIYRKGVPEQLMKDYPFPFTSGVESEKLYFAKISQFFDYYFKKNQKGQNFPRCNDFDFSLSPVEYIYFRKGKSKTLTIPEEGLIAFEQYCQHHGLYTHLLDWSYNIMVALCFAVQEESDDENAALYVLNPVNQVVWQLIGFYTPEYNININAHNQCGVVSYLRESFRKEDGKWTEKYAAESYEKLLAYELLPSNLKQYANDKFLWKFKIPIALREEILNYCQKEGVNYKNLFR